MPPKATLPASQSFTAKHIEKDFIVMSPAKQASIEPYDTGIYQRLEENYAGFSGHELIACYEFDSDWDSWEIHPNGDEIVLLLAGNITFVLLNDGVETSVVLEKPGSFLIVPKGIWHTAKTQIKTKVLFITPGEATLNRSQPG